MFLKKKKKGIHICKIRKRKVCSPKANQASYTFVVRTYYEGYLKETVFSIIRESPKRNVDFRVGNMNFFIKISKLFFYQKC